MSVTIVSYSNSPLPVGAYPENAVTIRENITAAKTDYALLAGVSGTRYVVTRCSVIMDNANTVDVAVRIGFGASSTPTATGVLLAGPGFDNGAGAIEGTGAGVLGIGTDGQGIYMTSEVPTTGSFDVVITYIPIT